MLLLLYNASLSNALVSGDSNFSMDTTSLTVGGFSQPSVARSLIEQPGSAKIRLSQRFLWCFPKPSYSHFVTLEEVDKDFTQTLGEQGMYGHNYSYEN